jgi:hypothetical protein
LAKTIWNILRSIWINTYIGPPDVIVTNAKTNLKAEKFVQNAKAIIIEIENVLIEAYYAIGKIERYYIYILILRRLTPSVHLLANSKGSHVTGKKPLAAA